MNPWILVVLAGVLEMVWALGLKYSQGFTLLVPSVITAVAVIGSFWMLSLAMRELPVGTAYAVWVGIGAALTVAYAMVTGDEQFSLVRVLLILGLVGCVVGLKLVGGEH